MSKWSWTSGDDSEQRGIEVGVHLNVDEHDGGP